MEVFEAAKTVLAVREFEDKSVKETTLNHIIESARLTGSSMNAQPWQFIIIKNRETLSKLGSIVTSGSYTSKADFAIVVLIETSSQYAISDASRAIQSMILTAWSEGIGSNWTGWVGMKKVGSLLGVPKSLDVIAVIPFGYPINKEIKGQKKRKPISEIVHKERFGQPFSKYKKTSDNIT